MCNPKTGKETGFTASKNKRSTCFAEETLDVAKEILNEEVDSNLDEKDTSIAEEKNEKS